MEFFHLLHIYEGSAAKDLGYFSSLPNIQKAKERLNEKPGFSNYQDGYIVIRRSSPCACEGAPFFEAIVYYHSIDFSTEYSSSLGYYGTEQEAQCAIADFEAANTSNVPDMIRELIVNKCDLNKLLWAEGFV